jgi:hypothetical protein
MILIEYPKEKRYLGRMEFANSDKAGIKEVPLDLAVFVCV